MRRDDHPLASADHVRWRELKNEDIILLGRGSGNEVILGYTLNRLKLGLRGRFKARRPSTAMGLVAAGAVVVILPGMTLRKGSYPRIRTVRLVEPVVERESGLIKRRDCTLSPAADALYGYVRDAFRRTRS